MKSADPNAGVQVHSTKAEVRASPCHEHTATPARVCYTFWYIKNTASPNYHYQARGAAIVSVKKA
jgi:hypothetical protein